MAATNRQLENREDDGKPTSLDSMHIGNQINGDGLAPAVRNAWEEGTGSLRRRWKEMLLRESSFHYDPLPRPSCIRLLVLEPGKPSDVVRCSTEVVDLDEKPIYTALSYSWEKAGSFDESWSKASTDFLKAVLHVTEDKESQKRKEEAGKKAVICNGQKVLVFPNLHHALLQLRHTHSGKYWIDAVCINLQDHRERMAQVEMMGRIYQAASSVTVWLGSCSSVWSAGIEKLIAKTEAGLLKGPEGESLEDNMSLSAMLSTAYLLTRRWHKRLWTLQEVCLAQHVVFRLGRHEMEAENVILIAKWAEAMSSYVQGKMPMPFDWISHIKNFPAVMNSREFFREGGRWTLEQWLQTAKGRRVTQARDIIYGGLALVQPESLKIDQNLQLTFKPPSLPPCQGENAGPMLLYPPHPVVTQPLWSSIHPDYDVETSVVFLNLAACLLSQVRGVNLLFSILPLFRDPGLAVEEELYKDVGVLTPSWVPNAKFWTSRKIEPLSSGDHVYASCTQMVNNPKISLDGQVLQIDVASLDTIKHIWIPDVRILIPKSFSLLLFFSCTINIAEHYSPSGATSTSILADFAHVMVAGKLSKIEALIGLCRTLHCYVREAILDVQEGPAQLKEHPVVWQPRSREDRIAHLNTVWEGYKDEYPDAPWPAKDISVQETDEFSSFEQIQSAMMDSRSVFVTEGGYLSLGPDSTQAGDKVMLVKETEVFYVFRHIDEHLRWRAQEIEKYSKSLQDQSGAVRAWVKREDMLKTLEARLRDTTAQIGYQDGWVLLGEAYVDGVMYGEAITEGTKFERLDIV